MGKSINKITPKTEKSASEKLMEVLVVVMPGLSAFMIAWVSWVADSKRTLLKTKSGAPKVHRKKQF